MVEYALNNNMPLIHLTCIQHFLVLLLFLLQKFLLCPGAHFGIGRKPLLCFDRVLFDVKESCSCTLKTHNHFCLERWKMCLQVLWYHHENDDTLVYSSTAGISDWLCFFIRMTEDKAHILVMFISLWSLLATWLWNLTQMQAHTY